MRTLIVISLLLITGAAYAQEHSYKQFTTADGLPSNVVYGAFEDNSGYIWFCTNAGVSRFNGISFQNFTVEHGLSDNEVFGAFQTRNGRIWFRTFSNRLCYYENNTFHNAKTDPWLDTSYGSVRNVYAEDGIMWARDYLQKVLYRMDEKNRRIERSSGYFKDSVVIVTTNGVDTILAAEDKLLQDKVMAYKTKHKKLIDKMPDVASYYTFMMNYVKTLQAEHPSIPHHYLVHSFASTLPVLRFKLHDLLNIKGSYWVTHANKGILRVNDPAEPQQPPYVYLPNRNINNILIDREGNFWFTSPTEGVFFLSAHGVRTYDPGKEKAEIYSVTGNHRYIICGKDNEVMFINKHTGKKFSWVFDLVPNNTAYNRIKDMLTDGPDQCWLATDIGAALVRINNDKVARIYPPIPLSTETALYAGAIKSLARGTGNTVYMGSHSILCKIDPARKITFLSWRRITAIVETAKDELLVGSTDGLYKYSNGTLSPYLRDAINNHITDLQRSPAGFICAATNEQGLIVLKDKQFWRIMASDSLKALTSNICRKMTIDEKGDIWVCTNNGLCRVTITSWKPFAYKVQQFTTDDGLISNDVNDVYVSNDTVWAATSGGLSYFRQAQVKLQGAEPYIYISRADTLMNRFFNHRAKLAIGLEGISYESLGKLRYRYRVKGLYQDWRYTDRNLLLYDLLPPGQYELEVYSINRFGQESRQPATVIFTIVPPWWLTNWAYALYFIAFAGLLAVLLLLARRNLKQKESARIRHLQQLQQLELKALRSQMNPHFIFNMLNAVQKYILENDKEASYRYLTRFSKLIRGFLENSRQSTISLKDELELLRAYMEMEALRFRNKFTYEVEIEPTLDPASIYIPSMLIQPYVENAIWHGIQHKETNGFVKLSVQDLGGNVLRCRIQDNGIGRKKAGEIESAAGIQHQPVGMTITQQRLAIINEKLKQVSVNFIDLMEESNGAGSGTIVELIVTYVTKKP